MNAYLLGRPHRDRILEAFAKGCGAALCQSGDGLKDGPAVLMGFDQGTDDLIIQCMNECRDFYFIDHAYFDRGYETGNFRVIKNGIHQTKILKAPPSGRSLEPWKKPNEDDFVIIIPPPPKLIKVFDLEGWTEETVRTVKKYTDRPILVKPKDSQTPLSLYLTRAHCVVSFSSVAEVEAVVSGVPVFVSDYSPASPVGCKDFRQIESPIYPERQGWIDSLAYSQFHVSQMESGEAWRILNAV